MIDISAVGAKLTIYGPGNQKIEITQFSDEGTPFEANDVDVSTNQKNLNGQMISSRTPSVYSLAVTVVPGSEDDVALQRLLQKSSLMPGGVNNISDLKISSAILTIPAIDGSGEGRVSGLEYKWMNGRMKSGPTGPSTSAEGRMSARTYTMEFEKFDPAKGQGVNIENP